MIGDLIELVARPYPKSAENDDDIDIELLTAEWR